MGKFYAIKRGRKPGIYTSWDTAKRQVAGFSGAVYKGFNDRASAEAFLAGNPAAKTVKTAPRQKAAIIVYTDGGSRNTGNVKGGNVQATDKAAWAYRIQIGAKTYQGTAGQYGATNNQMEMTALLEALRKLYKLKLNEEAIQVISDSRYLLDSIQKGWLKGWADNGWHKSDGAPVKNQELWRAILQALDYFPKIELTWTKGHNQEEGNEFVDHLLNETMDQMK